MYIDFELLNKIKCLISEGRNLKDISCVLNLDLNYVEYLISKVKIDIIFSSISDEFYLVPIIDKLLNKKIESRCRFPYIYQYKILDMLHLSDEEIIKRLNINLPRLLSFLRSMYFMLYIYNIDGVDKSYLPIIKNRIDCINISYKRNSFNRIIYEYNDYCDVLFPNGNVLKKEISFGKIYDFFNTDIKFIIISDLHFGAVYENVDYIKRVYDYASKNGINYIIVTGDMIEGNCFNYQRCKKEYKNIYAQLEHVFADYCYDSSIKNIILLGNHDFSSYVKSGIDVSKLLCNRDDFEILGYKEAYLKIGNDYITLKHEVSKLLSSLSNSATVFNVIGHSHQYRMLYNKESIIMKAPSLCDLSFGDNYVINRGFVVCELNFDDNELCNIETNYINFDGVEDIKFQRILK